MDAKARLLAKVEHAENGCWLWTAYRDEKGYGQFFFDGRAQKAHRVSYLLHVGPVPGDMQLDHLCRDHGCVNPTHLDPVTAAENTRRGIAKELRTIRYRERTHCAEGHLLSGDNLFVRIKPAGYQARECRTCRNKRAIEYYHRRKQAQAA